MKRHLFLAALILMLHPSQVFAEWQWVNPLPSGETLIDWSSGDKLQHVALGANGLILKTQDEGLTWSAQYAEGNPNLVAIHCQTSESFFAVATGGKILRSADGGGTWALLYQGGDELKDISFVNEDVGFAVGDGGVILSTQDGGSTWVRKKLPDPSDLKKIIFLNSDSAIAVCSLGGYWKTTNGGASWDPYIFQQTLFHFLSFVDDRLGYGFTYEYLYGVRYARIHKTEDGGELWARMGRVRATYSDDPSLSFHPDGRGVFLDGEYVYRTIDDGQSFQSVKVMERAGRGFGKSESGTLYIYGDEGLLLQSHDAGETWSDVQAIVLPHQGWQLIGGLFVNEETGYLFDQENIYKTSNDGLSWQTKLNAPWASFSCLSFPSARVGYASGSRLWSTADGGETWFPLEIGFNPDLVQFVTENKGFVSEEGGNFCWGGGYGGYGGYGGNECPSGLYVTSDGGTSWIEVPMEPIYGSSFGISSFHFPSPSTGFVARYKGYPRDTEIWRFRDAGGTGQWSRELLRLFSGSDICFIHFRDEVVGLAASDGEIYRTLDGGENWELVADLTTEYGITGIRKGLFDAKRNTWYVLTENCQIFASEDANGSSWAPFWSPGCLDSLIQNPSALWGLRYSDSEYQVLRYMFAAPTSGDEVPPETPVNLEPLDGAAEPQPAVLLRSSLFQDQNPGDTHAASQWQIAIDPEFIPTTLISDSGRDEENLTSYFIAPGLLTYGLNYFFRVRYKDSTSLWSAWSAPTRFFVNHPPETPSLNEMLLPADSVYYTTSPSIPFSRFADQDGDSHRYTEIRLTAGEHCEALVWEDQIAGAVISSTVPSGLLVYGGTYCVEVRYKDSSMLWSGWSPPTPIKISSGPKKPANLFPIPEGEGEPGSFLEASALEDDFASHMASEWQICRGVDFLCMVHETETQESLARLAIPDVLLQDRIYSWRVRYQNVHGRWSAWSEPTSFVFMPLP
jgi:photosystem II stability/assembly factor-like uncharacterized protein